MRGALRESEPCGESPSPRPSPRKERGEGEAPPLGISSATSFAPLTNSDEHFVASSTIEIGLPAQERRDIELILIGLRMHRGGPAMDVQPLGRAPPGEFRDRLRATRFAGP